MSNSDDMRQHPILPDYGVPDMSQPSLMPQNDDTIPLGYVPEGAPDPGRDVFGDASADGLERANIPITSVPPEYARDIPSDKEINAPLPAQQLGFTGVAKTIRSPLDLHPLVPDMQNPDVELPVEMDERPGELAADASGLLRQDLTYQQVEALDDNPYMDPRASHRMKHFALQEKGLDGADGKGDM